MFPLCKEELQLATLALLHRNTCGRPRERIGRKPRIRDLCFRNRDMAEERTLTNRQCHTRQCTHKSPSKPLSWLICLNLAQGRAWQRKIWPLLVVVVLHHKAELPAGFPSFDRRFEWPRDLGFGVLSFTR